MLLEQTKQLKSNQPHRWWGNIVCTQTGFSWLSKPHRVCIVWLGALTQTSFNLQVDVAVDPNWRAQLFSQIMALQPFRLKRCSGLLQCAQKRCMNLAFGQFLCTSFQVLYQPVIKILTAVWLENYWTQEMDLPIAWPSLFCSPFEP